MQVMQTVLDHLLRCAALTVFARSTQQHLTNQHSLQLVHLLEFVEEQTNCSA
jgi:hypothetical protein